ncbi:MAG: NRDE family protein, partial [Acidimicrobiales bacterium]
MCLLVMVSDPGSEEPLVVGANRDERLDRPALTMTVLRGRQPRILGGRDLLAGGTWLAVNEHGVVAGLTNTPTGEGRDATRRSRGELPLRAARFADASQAVDWLAAGVRPEDYNPAWMLVGDRRSLFAVTIAGARPAVTELAPGTHVVENRPPGTDSPKVRHVLEQLRRSA